MELSLYPFSKVPQLSKRDVIFQEKPEVFRDFLSFPFEMYAFTDKMKDRKHFPINRPVLAEVISDQYKAAGIEDGPYDQIEMLKDNDTFTVITAHQPSLLTGPLYFIYKIISVINLAEKLSAEHDARILPVFIIGSEDHDFEEVNHLTLFGNKIEWQTEQGGPVGRMHTDGISSALDKVYEILGSSEHAAELKEIIASSFEDVKTYNTAVFRMVHKLFKEFNLIVLLTDDKRLKREFIPQIKKEIFERPSQELILKSQEALEALDLKSQAHAREINFFYLQEGRRDRIELDGEDYVVVDTEVTFTKSELEEEINNFPERFSPNVVMRPIYQESILPNLAYLGGGGEIAYWTERKTQFEAFHVSFPILIRRNSVLWVDKGASKQLKKYEIDSDALFASDEEWVQDFVKSHSGAELEFSEEFELFNKAFELLAEKAKNIDANLAKSILGTQVKQFKTFEQLTSRLLRTEKDRLDTDVRKIRKLHDKLFPSGSLQERKDNFIPIYLKHGRGFLQTLKDNLDPFNDQFIVISEE